MFIVVLRFVVVRESNERTYRMSTATLAPAIGCNLGMTWVQQSGHAHASGILLAVLHIITFLETVVTVLPILLSLPTGVVFSAIACSVMVYICTSQLPSDRSS